MIPHCNEYGRMHNYICLEVGAQLKFCEPARLPEAPSEAVEGAEGFRRAAP
jgi:hypothetical protein